MSIDKYKVTNWSSYNNGLKNRGSITLWLNSELTDQWNWRGKSKRGANMNIVMLRGIVLQSTYIIMV